MARGREFRGRIRVTRWGVDESFPYSMLSREVATLWWDLPVYIVISLLAGLLGATYVGPPRAGEQAKGNETRRPRGPPAPQ